MRAVDSSAMKDLVALMHRCEADTRDIVGKPAANMLSHWQQYQDDFPRLVKFIRDRIRSETKINGGKLHQNRRLSLEEIVALRFPEPFAAEDIRIARETLGV